MLAEREHGLRRSAASSLGSTGMSISSATSALRNDGGRTSSAKKSTHGSKSKSSQSMSLSSMNQPENSTDSGENRMPRSVLTSTAHGSKNLGSFSQVFSPISSEEDFHSNENEDTTNTGNSSSSAQLLSPRTQEAFNENPALRSL